ncbi:PVC-type heme-binding CxxCH protein [Synoicihabitans lomoniglobus]|uniref:HEAT repeat domain-containing protein n=1 Tax=Synoicihabitans lomoniglobus TaxID=2909285 RepID=A0AAF0CRZ5_9BACT|nr:HEAT repeat domain-containing protein [Opitutaceae bacterium LMO-M01]WED66937.1 HEAT repeat domain-containing protein [Opitutaceae bacterium LMO-M01]
MKIRSIPPLLATLLTSLTLLASVPPPPQLELEDFERLPEPVMTPASPAAERAISQFRAPENFEIKLWAAEPMLSNPVAFDFDEQGRLFVAETHRYRSSVLDIRGYMGMLENELAAETIEDRLRYTDAIFGEESAQLAIETEVVRLIQDTDGDGVADDSRVFADGFNSKLDGIASGVLAHRGKVWFTNIPSLWQFDTDAEGTTETARHELLRGFGVRFGYTGHDLHGLILGPDGKLYFSIGDRSTNVTAPDGNHVKVLDQGAVFRANPDGSEMEVVATGLRNPQELAFDEYGDLLTGDNDCDNGDLERLVHVVEGGDYGWRVGYQFAPLGRAGPWMSDDLWKPDFPGRPAYLLPAVANIEDGPSGITYYPGTGFSSDYDQTLFITHFKGNVARSGVQAYKLERTGASFKVVSSEPFIWGMLPTDVTFAPDGKFYFVDWVVGWPKSSMGRVYSMSPKNRPAAEVALSREVTTLIGGGIQSAATPALLKLLAHRDQRVRTEAQFEIVERGAAHIPALQQMVADPQAPQLARLHALWGLSQLQRVAPTALSTLAAALTDNDNEVRAQAAKVAGDLHQSTQYDALIAALRDSSPRVRFFAAQSLGKLDQSAAAPALLDLLRRNNNADLYIRHAATHALVQLDNRAALVAAEKDPSAAVRLGVILAYRHLDEPRIANFLTDADPYLVRETALAINDGPVKAARPALAALLGSGDLEDIPLQHRIINARHRLGRPQDAAALADFAARSDVPDELREEALYQLSTWPEPFQRDRLVGVYRPLPNRDAAPAMAALESQLSRLLDGTSDSLKRAVLTAALQLEASGTLPQIRAIVADATASGEVRAVALNVLDELGDSELITSVKRAGVSDSSELRMATLPILARLSPQEALPVLSRMAGSAHGTEQQAAFKAIAELDDPAAGELLIDALAQLRAGEIPYIAQFELLDAAEASTSPAVQSAVAELKAHWTATGDTLAPFRGALEGGDGRKGWRLFNQHPVLACTRCHKTNGEGGEAGPDLTTIAASQSAEYILESIIEPNAAIAPGFDVVAFTLKDGDFVAGTIAEETAERIVVWDAMGEKQEINPANVVERAGAPSSMPPIFGLVLKRDELRDLMAFMRNLKPRDLPSEEEGGEAPRATHGEL